VYMCNGQKEYGIPLLRKISFDKCSMLVHSPVKVGAPVPIRFCVSASPVKHGASWSRKTLRVQAYAELTSKGKQVDATSLVLGTQLGSGSFGEVFKGTYITDEGREAVVLKRVKTKVEVRAVMPEVKA